MSLSQPWRTHLTSFVISCVLTGLFAFVVVAYPRTTVIALTANTETMKVIFKAGSENTWSIAAASLSILEPVSTETGSMTVRRVPVLENTGYDRLQPSPGAMAHVRRVRRGPLSVTLTPGPSGSTAHVTKSHDDSATPRVIKETVYLEISPTETQGGDVFPFYGDVTVGHHLTGGPTGLVLSGTLRAFESSPVVAQRFQVAEQGLDPGDVATFRDRSDHRVFMRGFFRVAPAQKDGLTVAVQGIAAMATIARTGETSKDVDFQYVFAPSWTNRFLADPFAVAITAFLVIFQLILFLVEMIGTRRARSHGEDTTDGRP